MTMRLRQSMDYLHTWAGVLLSILLFVVVFMGTVAVFDRELDRWMMPITRVVPPASASFDRIAKPQLEVLAPNAKSWTVQYPNAREPVMRLGWLDGGVPVIRYIDANTGQLLPDVGSKGGTGFFFPFHYSFHLKWKDIGYWLLALAGIAMLVLLVSGVIIHKKFFTDFFTFRPFKSTQRATLDLHNASSVLLLPFHFIMALSGLIIFVFILMKPGFALLYGGDPKKATQEAYGQVTRVASGEPGELASVDAMVARAQGQWGGGGVRRILILQPQDAHATVEIQRHPHDRMVYDTLSVTFDGATGAILHRQDLSPVMKIQRFFTGLHMIPFDHWWVRWLYFAMGLMACVMIGTGLLLWVEKRRLRQEKEGRSSYRIVNAISIGGTLGVLVATLVMLVANKLLPTTMVSRASVEQWIFFAAWITCLLHALARAFHQRHATDIRIAWREQTWLIAMLALLAVVLNATMTGDHLLAAIQQRMLAVAGTDLVLLATAALAMLCARRLSPNRTMVSIDTPLHRMTA